MFFQPKAALLCCLLFWTCQDRPSPATSSEPKLEIEPKAHSIIERSIATHGGLERWQSIKSISYTKAFALLDSTGQVESDVFQNHHYQYGNQPNIAISWQQDGVTHRLEQKGDHCAKSIDGSVDVSVSSSAAQNSIYTSTYVHGIPYKLLDPGPRITYEGVEEIWTGELCDVLKVVYDPAQYDNLTTADIWWYYFSQEDGRVRAGKVKHLDHISGIRNISYREADGFLFNHERESHRLDSSGKALYLRASYVYDDYQVDVP
ncbi:MAG: hypothetical protein KTR24_15885 [Saprospiraceae bacterium]|nr:hypothetical protein [Saprospiraceae bacterium]